MKVFVVKCSVIDSWDEEWFDMPFHKTPESAQRKIEKLRLANRSPYVTLRYSIGEVEVVEEE